MRSAVVNRMAFDAWEALDGATFTSADRQYADWTKRKRGVYATNGALLSVTLPSGPGRSVPDLFCYALLGKFAGYVAGVLARSWRSTTTISPGSC